MFRCLPENLRTVAIGQDEPAFFWKDFSRHLGMRRKEEPIRMQPVFGPFAVHPKILHRRFNLDDPDVAATGQRNEICTPACGQRKLRQNMRPHARQQALNASPDQHCAVGLAAVHERVLQNRRNYGHESSMDDFVHGLNLPASDCPRGPTLKSLSARELMLQKCNSLLLTCTLDVSYPSSPAWQAWQRP